MVERRFLGAALALLGSGVLPGASLAADGAALFGETCAACHGENGVGIDGLAPPLVDPELWGRLGEKAPTYLAGVMAAGLSGKINVKGIDYVGLVMPPQTAVPDADLAAIGAYVLQELNGRPAGPDEAAIAAAKAAPPAHKALRALRSGE